MGFWVGVNSNDTSKSGLFDQKVGVYSRKTTKTGLFTLPLFTFGPIFLHFLKTLSVMIPNKIFGRIVLRCILILCILQLQRFNYMIVCKVSTINSLICMEYCCFFFCNLCKQSMRKITFGFGFGFYFHASRYLNFVCCIIGHKKSY